MPLPFLALRLGDLARAAGLRAGDLALAAGFRAGDLARPRGFGAGDAALALRVATMVVVVAMVSSWGWLFGLPRLPGGVEAFGGSS